MDERVQRYVDMVVALGINVGGKIVGALLVWVIGRVIIRAVLSLMQRSAPLKKLDVTLAHYLESAASVLLNILLVIAVLSVFGVETTTFASLLAAVGIAIGMAWSGLLSNLAAGIFMILLRPFKVGDLVTAGGVTGAVHSIGLFATALNTPDNVRTIVGNSKIFSDTIQNYSTNPFRRVDCTAQLAHGADHEAAITRLRARLALIDDVVKEPAPMVEILEFNLAGPVLAVRPFCHGDHYGGVFFATTRVIREELGKLGLPVPGQHVHIQQLAATPPLRNGNGEAHPTA
ncbi:mechanosensitive ion channel family protein [Sorangium cellulosum]|uniref:Mechanosensitive ion channel protein MscS n=1 Tax=Sorangium cellulosum TaxID=56 RepID=A0A150Q1C1_SORCE|nr:mechanosensitive ion channel family protein [Sorangium cellulosum]KYF61774.1 mechanosensitive ion channel protein MscS [Sorangium cellulosum]